MLVILILITYCGVRTFTRSWKIISGQYPTAEVRLAKTSVNIVSKIILQAVRGLDTANLQIKSAKI